MLVSHSAKSSEIKSKLSDLSDLYRQGKLCFEKVLDLIKNSNEEVGKKLRGNISKELDRLLESQQLSLNDLGCIVLSVVKTFEKRQLVRILGKLTLGEDPIPKQLVDFKTKIDKIKNGDFYEPTHDELITIFRLCMVACSDQLETGQLANFKDAISSLIGKTKSTEAKTSLRQIELLIKSKKLELESLRAGVNKLIFKKDLEDDDVLVLIRYSNYKYEYGDLRSIIELLSRCRRVKDHGNQVSTIIERMTKKTRVFLSILNSKDNLRDSIIEQNIRDALLSAILGKLSVEEITLLQLKLEEILENLKKNGKNDHSKIEMIKLLEEANSIIKYQKRLAITEEGGSYTTRGLDLLEVLTYENRASYYVLEIKEYLADNCKLGEDIINSTEFKDLIANIGSIMWRSLISKENYYKLIEKGEYEADLNSYLLEDCEAIITELIEIVTKVLINIGLPADDTANFDNTNNKLAELPVNEFLASGDISYDIVSFIDYYKLKIALLNNSIEGSKNIHKTQQSFALKSIINTVDYDRIQAIVKSLNIDQLSTNTDILLSDLPDLLLMKIELLFDLEVLKGLPQRDTLINLLSESVHALVSGIESSIEGEIYDFGKIKLSIETNFTQSIRKIINDISSESVLQIKRSNPQDLKDNYYLIDWHKMQEINQINVWFCEIFTMLSEEIVGQFNKKIAEKYHATSAEHAVPVLYLDQIRTFAHGITSTSKAEPFQKINSEVFETICGTTNVDCLDLHPFTNIPEQILSLNPKCDLITEFPDLNLLKNYLQLKKLIWGYQKLTDVQRVSAVNSLREICQLAVEEIEIYEDAEKSSSSVLYNKIILTNIISFLNSYREQIQEILTCTEIFAKTSFTKKEVSFNLHDQLRKILEEPVDQAEEIGTLSNVVTYFKKQTIRNYSSLRTDKAA